MCYNYIKLYNDSGVEIAAFYNISDFSKFAITGGTFVDPCGCAMPIPLSIYSVGGRTITTNDWILSEDETFYYYEISHDLISANATTCNVMLLFAQGTELEYTATQEAGKITLHTEAALIDDVVIESIQITRT